MFELKKCKKKQTDATQVDGRRWIYLDWIHRYEKKAIGKNSIEMALLEPMWLLYVDSFSGISSSLLVFSCDKRSVIHL